MQEAKGIIEKMGIKYAKPDVAEARAIAESLGIELTDIESEAHSIELRNMSAARSACTSCNGLEHCTAEPAGYEYVFSRGFRNLPYFSLKKCQRRVQYEELLKNEDLLVACKIPVSLRQKSFQTFDGSENPYAFKVAVDLIKDKSRKGAIFYGSTGVGKTHLVSALLNNRILKGGIGIYATVPDLMDSLRSAMRKNTIDTAREALIDAELIFLDDIGAENPSEFSVEELFKIVNGRSLNGKQIVGTSNLSPDGLLERYAGVGGARIVSRLSESCEWVEMIGRDHRINQA